jgi:hypothetical protein
VCIVLELQSVSFVIILAVSFSCSKECEQKTVATNDSVRYVSVYIAVLAIAESINVTVFSVLFKYLIAVRYSGLFICLLACFCRR